MIIIIIMMIIMIIPWLITASISLPLATSTSHSPGTNIPFPLPISLNIKSGWPIGAFVVDDGGGGGADAVLNTSVIMSFDGSRVYHENVTLPILFFLPSLVDDIGNDSNNCPAANDIIPHLLLDESDNIYFDIS